MSWFTRADGQYLKASIDRIAELSESVDVSDQIRAERDNERARLFAFIDGTTLEKGKGSE